MRAVRAAARVNDCAAPWSSRSRGTNRVGVGGGLADLDHHLLEPLRVDVERLAALDALELAAAQLAACLLYTSDAADE